MPHDPGSGPQPPKPHKPKPHRPKPPASSPARDQHNHPQNPPQPRPPRRRRRPHRDPLLGSGVGVPRSVPKRVRGSRRAAKWLRQHNSRSQAVMRRQMVLRAAGYHVAVDGVWGPASQDAWSQFQHGNSGHDAPAPYSVPKGPLPLTDRQRELRSFRKSFMAAGRPSGPSAFDRAHQRADRLNAAAGEIEHQRQQLANLAHRVAADPESAAKLTLRKLTDVLTDPDGGLDPTSHAGARAAQSWLRQHGYHVPDSGTWDKATHDAFARALDDAQRRIEQRQTHTLVQQLYRPAGLHAGDRKPDWLAELPGDRVPAPGAMLRLLQRGGFSAGIVYNQLVSHAQDANFRDFQHTQLLRLAAKFQPFAIPSKGFGIRPSNASLYGALSSTIPNLQLSPYGTNSKYGQRDEARRQANLLAQVDALYTARNPDDFKAKLASYTQQEERRQIQLQQERAAHHVGFFSKALHAVLVPGEYTREALVADALMLRDSFNMGGFSHKPRQDYIAEAQGAIANMPLAGRIAFELIVDPLNFVDGVGIGLRLGSTTLRFATKGEALGRYVVTNTGQDLLRAGWKEGADAIMRRAVRYEKGTWSKWDVFEGFIDHAYGAPGAFRLSKQYGVALRAVAMKQDALAVVRERLSVAVRHGFTAPAHPSAAGVNTYTPRGELQKQIADALTDVIAAHGDDPTGDFQLLLGSLTRGRVSLWMDAARTTPSTVGAQLKGFLASVIEGQVAHRLAGRAARDILEHGGGEAEARAEYRRVLDAIGSYLGPRGGGDEFTKAVQEAHRGQVAALLDRVSNLWFPAWQRAVEEAAVRDGVELFEKESGLWAFRDTQLPRDLRALARDTFEDGQTLAIRNPQYDVPHSYVERSAAIESEVSRLTARAFAYDRRMTLGNLNPESEFNALDRAEEIAKEVEGHWQERDGLHYDTREEVQVSRLYARHLDAAYQGATDQVAADDFLQHIAQAPNVTGYADTPFMNALERFSWRIGGRMKPTAKLIGQRHIASSEHLAGDFNDIEAEFANRIEQASSDYLRLIARAYDEALPVALREQLLLWQAATHARTAPLRYAAKAMQAGLNLWVFATLPLRAGWTVRNILDNWLKAFIAGVHDPRFFFLGAEHPGSLIRSVFDVGITPLREVTRFLDGMFGTDVLTHFDALLDHFWQLPNDVIRRVFYAHGIDVPEERIAAMKNDPLFRTRGSAGEKAVGLGDRVKRGKVERTQDAVWELFGVRPEAYWRRVIYRHTVATETRRLEREGFGTVTEIQGEAHRLALRKIEGTLFDYSKVTVVEDNFRVFFPFVQFWRKNFAFWAGAALSKPWLPLAYAKWERAMNDNHADLPEWMRRYVSSRELIDAAAVVPGLDKVVSALIPQDAMYDPLKFTSGAPLYRSFLSLVGEQENQNLPPGEGNGWPVIGPMLNAMNEWGLGVNPLIEKPLETGGVASARSWQTIFPEANLLIASAPDFWLSHTHGRVVNWARIGVLAALGADPDAIAKNLDFYINEEVADQVARGEQPDRALARKTIEDWFLTQNYVGYFTGMYLRRATPQDIYLSKLYDDAVTGHRDNFSVREEKLLHLWAMRGVDRYSFEKYLEAMPSINAYYRQPDFQSAQAYLDQHPELSAYVDPAWKGEPFSHNYIKQAQLHRQADEFFRVSQLSDQLDVDYDTRRLAESLLLTPEVRAMWKENGTPAQRRRRMVEGLVHKQLDQVNQGYFSIPETNYQARSDYLNRHPELIRLWNANNDAADDYEAILHDANAELRQQFFNLLHAGKHSEADAFLGKHPFIWEDTKAAHKFDPQTGQMKLQYLSAKAQAYMKAKPGFDKLDRLIARVGKKAAWDWLFSSSDPDAKAARAYIDAYGKHAGSANGGGRSQHALDYLAVRSILNAYFDMPPDTREAWLHGPSPEAAQLRAYFAKWSNHSGMTQHARDYLAVKGALSHYFSLSKAARRAWLSGGSKDADAVLAYFKKYGQTHKYERAYAKIDPKDAGGTPEQRMRLLFWKRYFALTPDRRPQFIHRHARAYGVFIYGPLAEKERDAQQQAWLRRAHGAHFTAKQLDYLYVKPLLDFYFTLGSHNEKQLFMEANPELEAYFQTHPPKVSTGNKHTDKLIGEYFALDVELRSAFLAAHPEVQRYFDKTSSPAQRAIHALLSQYFALSGRARKDFAAEHPEIAAYFDARRQEQANMSAASEALYLTDPHLAPYRENASQIAESAQRQLDRLKAAAIASFTPDAIEANRDREPYTGHSTGRHVQRAAASDIQPSR